MRTSVTRILVVVRFRGGTLSIRSPAVINSDFTMIPTCFQNFRKNAPTRVRVYQLLGASLNSHWENSLQLWRATE